MEKRTRFPPSHRPPRNYYFFLLEYPAGASAEERGTTFHFQQNRHFA